MLFLRIVAREAEARPEALPGRGRAVRPLRERLAALRAALSVDCGQAAFQLIAQQCRWSCLSA